MAGPPPDIFKPGVTVPPQVPDKATAAWQHPGDGRRHHGLAPEEFTPYTTGHGRVKPEDCLHPRFLDHAFGYTVLCLDCGCEVVLGRWDTLASPDQELELHGQPTYIPEGKVATRQELHQLRARWHAIWNLDGWKGDDETGWTVPAASPYQKVPPHVPVQGTFRQHP